MKWLLWLAAGVFVLPVLIFSLMLGARATEGHFVRQHQESLAFQCLMRDGNWEREVGQAWAFCLDSVLPPDHDWLAREDMEIFGLRIRL